jgi:N6-L-threonylcarbamoyladenine synthase
MARHGSVHAWLVKGRIASRAADVRRTFHGENLSRQLCLGIETSCDETAAAVVKGGHEILSDIVRSQIDLHRVFGGVVPEIACRAHIETILPVVDSALSKAKVNLRDIGVIAVTHRPGLIGALLVGLSAAKALALALDKPLVGVDHIEAHIYAARLHAPGYKAPNLPYPHVSLVISGGHTSLYLSNGPTKHRLLGATLDDAAGEAFDKVASVLGLGYPGGPLIAKAALKGDPKAVRFPRPMLDEGSFDFSFSGIKTAVLYHCKGKNAGRKTPLLADINVADVAAGFQEAVVDVLVEKTVRAARKNKAKLIVIGGGVACNARLREKFAERSGKEDLTVVFPPPKLCTDNAAMVAGLGFVRWKMGLVSDLRLDAVPTGR